MKSIIISTSFSAGSSVDLNSALAEYWRVWIIETDKMRMCLVRFRLTTSAKLRHIIEWSLYQLAQRAIGPQTQTFLAQMYLWYARFCWLFFLFIGWFLFCWLLFLSNCMNEASKDYSGNGHNVLAHIWSIKKINYDSTIVDGKNQSLPACKMQSWQQHCNKYGIHNVLECIVSCITFLM
jgi:hypothetical protein